MAPAPERRWFRGWFTGRPERRLALINVLSEARELLSRPGDDFSWSGWDSASAATQEIDGLIASIEAGRLPDRLSIEILCLPTGPIQEVIVSSGWGQDFLGFAQKMDSAVASVYGCTTNSRPRRWSLRTILIVVSIAAFVIGLAICVTSQPIR